MASIQVHAWLRVAYLEMTLIAFSKCVPLMIDHVIMLVFAMYASRKSACRMHIAGIDLRMLTNPAVSITTSIVPCLSICCSMISKTHAYTPTWLSGVIGGINRSTMVSATIWRAVVVVFSNRRLAIVLDVRSVFMQIGIASICCSSQSALGVFVVLVASIVKMLSSAISGYSVVVLSGQSSMILTARSSSLTYFAANCKNHSASIVRLCLSIDPTIDRQWYPGKSGNDKCSHLRSFRSTALAARTQQCRTASMLLSLRSTRHWLAMSAATSSVYGFSFARMYVACSFSMLVGNVCSDFNVYALIIFIHVANSILG